MKLYKKLAITAATVAFTAVSSAAIAQQSINDPARDPYYSNFKDRSVVFVPVFMGLDLTEGWSKMMATQAKALGYSYEVRNSNFNTAAGAQTITSLISEKPDVIVVQNPDVQSYARLLKRAEDAGIEVIQLNMKTNTLTTGFVGADVIAIGEAQANATVAQCGGEGQSGKVLVLAGPPTSPFSAYMLRGYENIFNNNDKMEVVSVQSTGAYESAKAKSITQVVVQQHPDLCAIVGVWDNTDIGTAAALDEAGLSDQVFLSTSGGGGELSCKGIREDMWDHYVSYDVPGQGRDLNALISSALQSTTEVGSIKTVLYTPLIEYTAENVDQQSCWTLDSIR
ncbi:MAG: sugar ABC transporter substrate-binding protein [Paracoccaceae bacterium]|jgi:ABC-type sugar transport system substrate-binding protein|tara:strand:+ start:5221 stop:6234 length:1014 start_codon:yes stop_codon:yes gene_type:complete